LYSLLQPAIVKNVHSGPEKIAQSLLHHNFAIVDNKVMRLHQNVKKLIGNIKGQNMNIVIKYSLYGAAM